MIPRHVQITAVVLIVAMFSTGFYILRLKARVERNGAVSDTRPIAPPVAGPKSRVELYIAYDQDGVIRPRLVNVALPQEPNLRAREVLRALVGEYLQKPSAHPLAPGADVKDVYLLNGGVAVVDTTAEFAEGHRSGVFVEELTVVSLVETLAANVPGVTRVKILVDGKERETLAGHADLMSFYDVNAVDQLVKAMQ
ncbi:MAG: GerMN domain-containing protein [Acidobacteriia bacterium]|nr:GerMN domain-containing protein [Terriglobia bacterium]